MGICQRLLAVPSDSSTFPLYIPLCPLSLHYLLIKLTKQVYDSGLWHLLFSQVGPLGICLRGRLHPLRQKLFHESLSLYGLPWLLFWKAHCHHRALNSFHIHFFTVFYHLTYIFHLFTVLIVILSTEVKTFECKDFSPGGSML